jgi:Zn-dependent peptidase ImmA (M78 family)
MDRLRSYLSDLQDASAFSSKAGIELARLRELQDGAEPSLSELRQLAGALRIPISTLTAPTTENRAHLLFRSAPVNGKGVSTISRDLLSDKLDASLGVLSTKTIEPDLAHWREAFEIGMNTPATAERNAKIFRQVFCGGDQLGPLLSLPQLVADRLGVMLFVVRSSEFDGASAFLDGAPFIFVSARFPPRMLFTLAHELGHLLAHHDPNEPFAAIDEDVENKPDSNRLEERYANAFASALLMPSEGFAVALRKIRELAGSPGGDVGDIEINLLSRIYGVSFWAAALRCEALRLIPRGGAAALNERLIKVHGSAEKRAAEVGLPPRPDLHFPPVPRILLEATIQKIRKGELSLGRAASMLELSISDIMAANAPTTAH